jgi:hypothetical protein
MKTWMSFQSDTDSAAPTDVKQDDATLGRENRPPGWQGTTMRERDIRLKSLERGSASSHRGGAAGWG